VTSIDTGLRGLKSIFGRINDGYERLGAWWNARLPKGLYARTLLIVLAPMIILQSVLSFVFLERHWNLVTQRLSAAVSRDIASLIDFYEKYPQDRDAAFLRKVAADRLGLVVELLPNADLPPPGPKPFFSPLDSALSREIGQLVKRPFWIDTVGNSNLIEVRIKMDNTVFRVFAPRNHAYASNSHIFLVWMLGTSLVLLTISILFLRNQIKPILALAEAAEAFGKGREVANFRPRGATEVRRAAAAFLEMKRRIERQIEQRTTMLAGVSHDMRTVLTRFKLELALLEDNPEADALRRDVDELQSMLEAYLAFARGESGETPATVDVAQMLNELAADANRQGKRAAVTFAGPPLVQIRQESFRRCVANLVANAMRYGKSLAISGRREPRWLEVSVDDDGPGIPANRREDVFRPFLRLDAARNQDHGGSGLGLSIARDIAGAHGGDIFLSDSPMGGLRATVRIPA
jgi:two-component system osmolarity sensor histidine kinase EnvZ